MQKNNCEFFIFNEEVCVLGKFNQTFGTALKDEDAEEDIFIAKCKTIFLCFSLTRPIQTGSKIAVGTVVKNYVMVLMVYRIT